MSTFAGEQVGRNDPCPCGSGKKYKYCHMRADREAAQKAEKERQAQLLAQAKAHEQEAVVFAAPGRDDKDVEDNDAEDEGADPRIELLNKLWEEFGRAEGERRWELCQSAMDNQLMDGEQAFEFFSALHRDAFERGLESRFVRLVIELREKCFDAYVDEIAYIFDWTFPFLTKSERDAFLPDLSADLITDGPCKVESFLNCVDLLAVLGESALYTQVVRAAQEGVRSAGLFEWALDAYKGQYIDTYLFEYLENTPPEARRDPEHIDDFLASLPFRDELLQDEVIAYLKRLAGERRSWSLEDLPVRTSGRKDDRIPPTTVDHVVHLSQEFLAYLRWEKGIPFVKGGLATRELRQFLANQEIPSPARRPKSRKRRELPAAPVPAAVLPLCPDREQLDRNLYDLMSFIGYQPYKGIALLEVIPYWLQFLEECHLIERKQHRQCLQALRPLVNSVQIYWQNETLDRQIAENLASAWALPAQ